MSWLSRTKWLGTGAAIAARFSKHVVHRLPEGKREVYLTFDDGPSDGTAILTTYLERHGIPATCFLTGERLKKHLSAEGDGWWINNLGQTPVGNHYYTHQDPWTMSGMEVQRSIDLTEQLLRSNTSEPNRLIRPPYGHLSPGLIQYCRDNSSLTVLWDIMPGDFVSGAKISEVADAIVTNISDGSIIVLHDIGKDHISNLILPVLDIVREALAARHLRFGSLSARLQ